jgi:hypothetical protein
LKGNNGILLKWKGKKMEWEMRKRERGKKRKKEIQEVLPTERREWEDGKEIKPRHFLAGFPMIFKGRCAQGMIEDESKALVYQSQERGKRVKGFSLVSSETHKAQTYKAMGWL